MTQSPAREIIKPPNGYTAFVPHPLPPKINTGDIKKNKYIYYSCTSGKGTCKKEWVREEELLSPMLEYLDKIKVSDDLIEKIVDYLKKSFEAEQEFYKQTHENLRTESNLSAC